MTGLFITFEGGDGAGKTTQFELLANELRSRGLEVCALHEPGGTPLGERIRTLLLSKDTGAVDPMAELMLFEAARAQLVSEVIKPALAAGKIVLCDRFADSTVAYQGFGRNLGEQLCATLNAAATGGLTPDRTILLMLEQGVAADRVSARAEDGEGDRMEAAGEQFHQRVLEGFKAQAAADPQRVHVVSGTGSIEEVHQRILADLADILPQVDTPRTPAGGAV